MVVGFRDVGAAAGANREGGRRKAAEAVQPDSANRHRSRRVLETDAVAPLEVAGMAVMGAVGGFRGVSTAKAVADLPCPRRPGTNTTGRAGGGGCHWRSLVQGRARCREWRRGR